LIVKDLENGPGQRPERLTFHGLRHTYATWKLRDGTDMRTLAHLLGHKTLAMVMRYAHPDLGEGQGQGDAETGAQSGGNDHFTITQRKR